MSHTYRHTQEQTQTHMSTHILPLVPFFSPSYIPTKTDS